MFTRTAAFPLTGPISLSVRLGHGSLTVAARDDLSAATVTLAAHEGTVLDRVTVELRGSTLTVAAPRQGGLADLLGGGRRGDAVDVAIEVPTGTPARIVTASAAVTASGTLGVADITTGRATVDLAEVAGDLRLRYGDGEARVGGVTGSVQLKAGRCEARFGDVAGDVHARSGAGSTTVGSAHGNVDLATGSGTLTIGVPTGVSVRLDVLTGSGSLRSDLPVEAAPRPGARAVHLRARTGSGDVRLLRAPAV